MCCSTGSEFIGGNLFRVAGTRAEDKLLPTLQNFKGSSFRSIHITDFFTEVT